MRLRAARGQQTVLSHTFYVGSTATDLDAAPEVTITTAAGVELASGTADVTGDDGRYEFTLSPAAAAALEQAEVEWIGTRDGVADQRLGVDELQIVGAHYFEIAELRLMDELQDTVRYPDVALVQARDFASITLEDACGGVAFVPRYSYEVRSGEGTRRLVLEHPRPRSIRTISEGGTSWSSASIAEVLMRRSGSLRRRTGARWRADAEYRIGYEHGYDSPPPRVVEATAMLARALLFESIDSVPDRATSIDTDAGTFRLVTAGVGRAMFDIPEVNAVVQTYGV